MNFIIIDGISLVVLAIAAALLKAQSGASEGMAKPVVYYLKKSLFIPATSRRSQLTIRERFVGRSMRR